jgi:hypothetical protein
VSDDRLTDRQMRLGSKVRGCAIAAILALYGYFLSDPGASFTASLLIAAGLQAGVLLLRRFVPADFLPRAIDSIELLADAATVLLFALGVFGGILSYGLEI